MNYKNFSIHDDIVQTYLDVPNPVITISTTAGAAASGVWVMVLNSVTSGNVLKPDNTGTASNISTSAAFKQLANYFYGTGTYITDANNGNTQDNTVKVIQFSKPLISEGLYPGTLTAAFSYGTVSSITGIDIPDTNSVGSALGLTGQLVNSALSTDIWGGVFYDYGVIVLNDSVNLTGAAFFGTSLSGLYIGGAAAGKVTLNQLNYAPRSILKRSIYFCRAYNKEFNYTYNPTARDSTGKLLASLSSDPATWITTVGLYNDDNDLLAVAKISPPKKKSFESEINIRVQLDF